MKKNSEVFFRIETEVLERLKKKADEYGISFSELIRQKLKEPLPLERMEFMIGEIHRKVVKKE